MNSVFKTEDCTGCSACIAVCPKEALSLGEDYNGFYRPILHENLCINCNLCQKVCPVNDINLSSISNKILDCYACCNRNDEIRLKSSSGGIFYELASKILDKNGIVYGCAWTSPVVAEHIKVKSIDELDKLTKSKYVQSKLNHIFRDIRKDLLVGKNVLFCGTPCQVAGLKSYLIKVPDNLITVDFICHGVPSPKSLHTYVSQLEDKYKNNVKSLNFRCKDNGWNDLSLEIMFDNGFRLVQKASEDPYYKAFLLNLGLAKCCSNCKFNTNHRASDITLGDFWGIKDKTIKKFCDDNGVSCVVVNSNKGKNLINSIKDALICKKVRVDDILEGNPFLNGHCKLHYNTDKYFETLNNSSIDFSETVNELLKPKFIDIVNEVATYKLKVICSKSINFKNFLLSFIQKKIACCKLKNKSFTIISNNCWAGFIYQKYGLKYLTPTIGLYFIGDDFVKFCSNIEYYLEQTLTFIPWESSRWYSQIKNDRSYPVGKLDDIEVYFMHYNSEEEAYEKWERRKKRINRNKIIFKMSQREGCSKKEVEAFMKLPYKNKICFAYDKVPGTIYVPELENFVGDEQPIVNQYFNDLEFLNNIE